MDFLTTEQAAEKLGVTPRRVQAMAQSGRLPASRFGRALMIRESDLALVADRKSGRPSKVASKETNLDAEATGVGILAPTKSRHKTSTTSKGKKNAKK